MLYYKKYFLHSEAEWVVFIHGAGGSSAIWFKQLKAFRMHFNLLLIDLRGHGKSAEINSNESNQSEYSFEMIASDIIRVIDHLKLPPAHFIGVSLGTIIIRQLGEMIGGRMKSMVLVGAIIDFNIKSKLWILLGKIFKNFMPHMWLYKLFAHVIMPSKNHAESRNVFIKEAQKLYRKEFLRWYKLSDHMAELFKKFKVSLPINTLYVMGDQDHLFLNSIRSRITDVQHAALLIIQDCGHVVNIEKPTIFNQHVINYLLDLKTQQEATVK